MNKGKLLVYCFIVWGLCFLFKFQSSHAQEYIIIKTLDQKVLKGYILNSIDSSGINLEMYGRDIHLPFSEIRKLSFPRKNDIDTKISYLENYQFTQFEKGFYHSFSMGLLFGGDATGVNISAVNGYKFFPFLNAGVGVNYQDYTDISTLPVYIEAKSYIKKGKFVPYYYGNLGYGFITSDQPVFEGINYQSKGGIYWAGGVGFQINYYQTALAFSLGYNFQKAWEEYSIMDWGGNEISISEKYMFRRLDFRISLIF